MRVDELERGRGRTKMSVDEVLDHLDSRGLMETVESVLKNHRVALTELVSRKRYPRIVRARDAVLHKIRALDPEIFTYPEIGDLFGLNSSTVIYAVRRHEARRVKAAA